MNFDKNNNLIISKKEIIDLFSYTINQLYAHDCDLFKNNAQERSLVARLSMYLRDKIITLEENGIYVDVEYNRDGDNLKRPHINDTKNWIAPDLLIHERGSKEHNYRNDIIYCEIKKASTSGQADATKIIKQMNERKYKYGIDLYKLSLYDCQLDLYYFDIDKNIKKESYIFDILTKRFRSGKDGERQW